MTLYYALDNPCLVYDYNCLGNITIYDGYTENNYVVDDHCNEGHTVEVYYDDGYIYASWRLG